MDDQIWIETDRQQFSMIYHDVTALRKLNIKEVGLLVNLMRYANHYTKEAFPSHKTLAEDLNTSVSTIRRNLETLEAKGVLRIEARYNEKNARTSNLYTIVDKPHTWLSEKDLKNGIKKVSERPSLSRQTENEEELSDSNLIYLQQKNTICNQACQDSVEFKEHKDIGWIKKHFDYQALADNSSAADADMVMDVINDVLNSEDSTLIINHSRVAKSQVVENIMQLTSDDLEYCLIKFKSAKSVVKNPKSYLRSILYNAKNQQTAEFNNKIM